KIIKAGGLVVRSFYDGPIPEGRKTLVDFLEENGICGISDVDTRGLTLKLRREGSRNAVILRAGEESGGTGLSIADLNSALDFVKKIPAMTGLNLTGEVGTGKLEIFNNEGSPHIALLDCGVKMNIIRELSKRGCRISVLPSDSSADDVLALKPDALLLSNGPGDPEPLEGPASIAESLMGKLPLWGICLGHQVLARAAGGRTYKMSFGHHGLNHPVRDEKTGRVFVTSQNHGFAVDEDSLPKGFDVRFRNANDNSIEGLENKDLKLLCVQHHPEASPGPVDSAWVFDAFLETLSSEEKG
ncbi:MAG: carbamoyl phosphate synthase small subunit, partial [Spirochaetaceae bacterium]|nr:carbamoyl phosphate synthase small subunit [Spirochaetaceae bacterium]